MTSQIFMNNPDSAITGQVIERALFMGIVGFIGMILNIFGDGPHADDERQGSTSPSYHRQTHHSVLPSAASQS
jgi:hypothetical protein